MKTLCWVVAAVLMTSCSHKDSAPPPPPSPVTLHDAVRLLDAAGAADAAPLPLTLEALVPPGNGWRCVYDQCARTCVYPHQPRPPAGVAPSLPPCNEQKSAFCIGYAATPNYAVCFRTAAACEAEAANSNRNGYVTTACGER